MAGSERIRAPSGTLVVAAEGRRVQEISLRDRRGTDDGHSPSAADLRRYLSGGRVDFKGYEVDWTAYTPFERSVLEATRRIPYGETRTYGQIAAAIGRPDAARAVGQALGKNRTCILIPCHRGVAANGGPPGFSTGLLREGVGGVPAGGR